LYSPSEQGYLVLALYKYTLLLILLLLLLLLLLKLTQGREYNVNVSSVVSEQKAPSRHDVDDEDDLCFTAIFVHMVG